MNRRGEVGAEESRKWGAGVRVTGRGWVRAEGAGPEVGGEDAGLGGSDAESLGSGVGEVEGCNLAGLEVEAGW